MAAELAVGVEFARMSEVAVVLVLQAGSWQLMSQLMASVNIVKREQFCESNQFSSKQLLI